MRIAALAAFSSAARALLNLAPPPTSPDFTLSANTVVTTWGTVVVGTLSAVNFDPNDVEFFIEETAAASGDEAGFAVVNG